MGTETRIGWTDHTFNPWWGCERVSPGCQHCYAEAFAKRTGNDVWGKSSDRRMFGDKHWSEPLKWETAARAAGRPALVFCASMADVFEDRRDLDDARARLFDIITSTPNLIWQLLTKRPENVLRLIPEHWRQPARPLSDIRSERRLTPGHWPTNAWIGTTVEDQTRADLRIPHLRRIPAPVRFLSCEPLLETIRLDLAGIDWVIVGGESGPSHRPMAHTDAIMVCRQVYEAGIPLYFKQWGGRTPTAGGNEISLYGHTPRPIAMFPPEAQRC